jgi:hemoglobin
MTLRPFASLLFVLLLPAAVAAQAPAPSPEEAAILAEEARLEAEEAAAADEGAIPGLAPGRLPPARDPSAPDPAPAHPDLRPVFDAFGGEAGLTALMDTFMDRLLADPRTQPFFANAEHARVKRQLVEQFCAILGGGCVYTGRDMRSAHAGLAIDRAEFNALVEVLQDAMDAHDVPFAAQNRLLAKLAPMHREVVTE